MSIATAAYAEWANEEVTRMANAIERELKKLGIDIYKNPEAVALRDIIVRMRNSPFTE